MAYRDPDDPTRTPLQREPQYSQEGKTLGSGYAQGKDAMTPSFVEAVNKGMRREGTSAAGVNPSPPSTSRGVASDGPNGGFSGPNLTFSSYEAPDYAAKAASVRQSRNAIRALQGTGPVTDTPAESAPAAGTGTRKKSFSAAQKMGLTRLSERDFNNLTTSMKNANTRGERNAVMMEARLRASGNYNQRTENMLAGYGQKYGNTKGQNRLAKQYFSDLLGVTDAQGRAPTAIPLGYNPYAPTHVPEMMQDPALQYRNRAPRNEYEPTPIEDDETQVE